MKLEILRAEVLEAEDEVDVTKMMLKRAQIKADSRIGMVVVKKGVGEISPS